MKKKKKKTTAVILIGYYPPLAQVSCKAQGSTPPTFEWYKNGARHFPKHVQEANGTLHFSGVLEEDKGNYTCVAFNSQGQINHTIKIDVVSKFLLSVLQQAFLFIVDV